VTTEKLEIFPIGMRYAVAQRLPSGRKYVMGEVEICLDSDETAWVTPTRHISMTEPLLDALADHLRHLGVKWMRGWGDGGRQGRVLTANGPVVNLPYTDVFIDEGD
jgi:hypothetical protein